jgi:mono/diheme cytochrome c family protein
MPRRRRTERGPAKRRVRRLARRLARAACVGAAAVGVESPAQDSSAETFAEAAGGASPYRIECSEGSVCAAQLDVYVGWRIYARHCARCHAADAEGSTFAPSLVHRMQGFDRRAFFATLDHGYAGRDAVLPPWGRDAEIARYYEELWAYLSARTRGDAPGGPLTLLRE